MTTRFTAIIFLSLLLPTGVAPAQVSSTRPANWTMSTPLGIGTSFQRLNLSQNTTEEIRKEVLDTNTVHLIAQVSGLSEKDLATICLVRETGSSSVNLYQVGESDKAFTVFREPLFAYVRGREDGHTKEFLFAAFTNHLHPATISSPELRALASSELLVQQVG